MMGVTARNVHGAVEANPTWRDGDGGLANMQH